MSRSSEKRLTLYPWPTVLTRRYWNNVEHLRGGEDDERWIRAAEHALVERFARRWRRHHTHALRALAREENLSPRAYKRMLVAEQLRLSIARMEESVLDWPSVRRGQERPAKHWHVPASYLRGDEPPLTAEELRAGVLRVPDRWLEDPVTIGGDVRAYMSALERDVLNQLDARLRSEVAARAEAKQHAEFTRAEANERRARTLLTDPEATLDEGEPTVIPMAAAWAALAARLDERALAGRKQPDREAAAQLAAKIRVHLDGERVTFERKDRELMRRMSPRGRCVSRDSEAERGRATRAREG